MFMERIRGSGTAVHYALVYDKVEPHPILCTLLLAYVGSTSTPKDWIELCAKLSNEGMDKRWLEASPSARELVQNAEIGLLDGGWSEQSSYGPSVGQTAKEESRDARP
jgi:hypothetical protein